MGVVLPTARLAVPQRPLGGELGFAFYFGWGWVLGYPRPGWLCHNFRWPFVCACVFQRRSLWKLGRATAAVVPEREATAVAVGAAAGAPLLPAGLIRRRPILLIARGRRRLLLV